MTSSPNTGAMAQVHGQPQAQVLTPPPQGTLPQTMLHLPHQTQHQHQHQHQHHQVLAGQGSQALNAVAGSGGAAGIQGADGSISGEGVQSLPNGSYSLDVGHLTGVHSTTSQLLQQQHQQQHQQQQQHGQQQLLALQQQQQQQQQQHHHHHNLHDLQEHHQQDDPTVVNQPDPTSNHARSQEEPIIPPNQDQEFETLEAAQESAERYARSVNTVVIVKRTTKDKNGNIVQKDLACERQGSYVTSGKKGPQVNARTKRCGCPWMISVGFSKRRGNRDGKRGRYTKVVLEHNHPLEPIPAELPPRKQPHVRAKTAAAAAAMAAAAIGGTSGDATKLDAGAQSSTTRIMASESSGTLPKSKTPRRANVKPASSINGSSSNNPPREISVTDTTSSTATTSRSDMDFEVARYGNPGTLLTESQAAAAVASNALSGLESLSSEVMSALGGGGGGAGSGSQVEPPVSWDDLKMRMNQIPWDLQAKVMRGLMDVLQVTQQTFQVPPIPGSRSADAEANAAATAAAIADVVGSLPPNYNPHPAPSQTQPQQQQQPQLRQQVQSQGAHPPLQAQSLRHPNRHAYVSSAVPVEDIGNGMSSATATSELLQLHRAEATDMHGSRMGNGGSGHSRQHSQSNSHRGRGDEQTSNGAMIPQSSLQSVSAIPTVVPTLPSTTESSVGSSSSTVIPLVTTDAPLLTSMPVLHNVQMDTTPLQSLDTTQQQLQNNILQQQQQRQHSRQANSLTTTNHQRSLSSSSVVGSSAPGATSTLSLAPDNASMIAHSRNSSSNSHRGSLESSPLLMQQALADVASRIHAQAQLQAQVDADTEAVVTAALNMNPLPRNNNGNSNNNTAVPEIVGSSESTTPVSTTHASGSSTANATPSPIPMNILDDATMRGLDLESYTQHLQQMHQQQQRLQMLRQQQQQLQQQQQQTQQQLQQQNPQLQQQPQQQQQQQQQQPDLLHTHSLNSNDDRHGIDLAGEPARKRVKS